MRTLAHVKSGRVRKGSRESIDLSIKYNTSINHISHLLHSNEGGRGSRDGSPLFGQIFYFLH